MHLTAIFTFCSGQETYENLILDQLNVSALGDEIVSSDNIDLEAFFD